MANYHTNIQPQATKSISWQQPVGPVWDWVSWLRATTTSHSHLAEQAVFTKSLPQSSPASSIGSVNVRVSANAQILISSKLSRASHRLKSMCNQSNQKNN